MKRHSALVPLSHDHHEGLLLAVRLQQGRTALLRLWSHDLFWQARFVVEFYETHLRPHFALEENVLFPAAIRFSLQSSDLVGRLTTEHRELESIVATMRDPDEKKLECSLVQFGALLERHIRSEERELFPMCEAAIPDDTWATIDNEVKMLSRSDSQGGQ